MRAKFHGLTRKNGADFGRGIISVVCLEPACSSTLDLIYCTAVPGIFNV